jgi:hypothetical protein
VRAAGENTLLLADGFSCRHQIRHGTGRTPLHLAEALQLSLREAGLGPARRGNGQVGWQD